MGITVYFGKVNLKSEHIYDVYSGKINIRDLLINTLISFYDGLELQEEYSYIGNDGEVYSDVIDYHVSLKEKQIHICMEHFIKNQNCIIRSLILQLMSWRLKRFPIRMESHFILMFLMKLLDIIPQRDLVTKILDILQN